MRRWTPLVIGGLGLLLASGLATGCAAVRVNVVCQNPAFNPQTIVREHLGFGGITPVKALPDMELDRLASQVQAVLQTRWSAAAILTISQIDQALGPEQHQRMLAAFENLAVLDPSELQQLRPLAGQVRFLLLLDIRRNEASAHHWTDEGWERERDYNSATGQYEDTITGYAYTAHTSASRCLQCVFVVYDLKSRQPAWIAVGKARASVSFGARHPLYPPTLSPAWPPPTSMLMESLLRKLAKRLPPPA